MIAMIDWTYVVVALIAGLPSIIAAVAAVSVRRVVSTPSGEKIGKQVEQAHHIVNANSALLTTITNNGEPSPPSETP